MNIPEINDPFASVHQHEKSIRYINFGLSSHNNPIHDMKGENSFCRLNNKHITFTACGFKMDQEKFESRLTFLLICICTIGLTVHTTLVTIDYLKYPMTSQVTIEMEKKFIPPALSICFHLSILRNSESSENIPCANDTAYSVECVERILYGYSIGTIFQNLTINLISSMVRLGFENGIRMPYEEIWQYVSQFLKAPFKCIRIQRTTEVLLRELDTMTRDILSIASNRSFVSSFLSIYYTHEVRTFPRGNQMQNFFTLENGVEFKFLSYKKTVTEYLPSPFSSNCADYSKVMLESKAHCMENCISKGIQKSCPSFMSEKLTITELDLFADLNFSRSLKNVRNYSLACDSQCPLSCLTSDYETIVGALSHEQHYLVRVRYQYPTTRVVFSPKQSFLEYLIYVASVTSLWFGFVINDSLKALFSSLNVCLRKIYPSKIVIFHRTTKVSNCTENHLNFPIGTMNTNARR